MERKKKNKNKNKNENNNIININLGKEVERIIQQTSDVKIVKPEIIEKQLQKQVEEDANDIIEQEMVEELQQAIQEFSDIKDRANKLNINIPDNIHNIPSQLKDVKNMKNVEELTDEIHRRINLITGLINNRQQQGLPTTTPTPQPSFGFTPLPPFLQQQQIQDKINRQSIPTQTPTQTPTQPPTQTPTQPIDNNDPTNSLTRNEYIAELRMLSSNKIRERLSNINESISGNRDMLINRLVKYYYGESSDDSPLQRAQIIEQQFQQNSQNKPLIYSYLSQLKDLKRNAPNTQIPLIQNIINSLAIHMAENIIQPQALNNEVSDDQLRGFIDELNILKQIEKDENKDIIIDNIILSINEKIEGQEPADPEQPEPEQPESEGLNQDPTYIKKLKPEDLYKHIIATGQYFDFNILKKNKLSKLITVINEKNGLSIDTSPDGDILRETVRDFFKNLNPETANPLIEQHINRAREIESELPQTTNPERLTQWINEVNSYVKATSEPNKSIFRYILEKIQLQHDRLTPPSSGLSNKKRKKIEEQIQELKTKYDTLISNIDLSDENSNDILSESESVLASITDLEALLEL